MWTVSASSNLTILKRAVQRHGRAAKRVTSRDDFFPGRCRGSALRCHRPTKNLSREISSKTIQGTEEERVILDGDKIITKSLDFF